jgi:septin family protein|tara:strand:+ start:105778 stop:106089 length:312 start_codon:yes stop_codon:yes gene_type:complete
MPLYSFKNKKTGKEFEDLMTIAEKEVYLKKNKHIQQMVTSINIISATGYSSRIKNDNGWKELQSKIAEKNPGTHFSAQHGKASTKDIKTRQVLRKHGILPRER